MKGYFAQIVQTPDGKLALNATGMITGHAGETVMVRFNGAPPRTKLLPAHHPVIQSLEIFDSTDDLKLFVDQQFKKPAPTTKEVDEQVSAQRQRNKTPLPAPAAVLQEAEEEIQEEAPEEEQEEAPSVKRVQEDEEEDRETARARRRARSNIWQVKWKGDMDDTYVTGCSSPREVKGKITQVFGPQNDSSYLSINRVLNDEVPDDRTTI